MIFDSTILAAVASEMRARLGNAASNRDAKNRDSDAAILRDIWQDGDDERQIFLQFRHSTFVVDTHAQRARCHFIAHAPRPSNTALSAVLRKALRGAQLVKIVQPNFDRILRLEFLARDETSGDNTSSTRYSLVLEMIDRRSNAILLDGDDVIIDAVKRLPPFLNRARTVLPHQKYQAPPSSRENPLLVDNWRERLRDVAQNHDFDLVLWLRDNFTGVSPLLARVVNNEYSLSNDAAQTCQSVYEKVRQVAHGKFAPVLCDDQPYPFAFDGACVSQSQSISALLEKHATSEDTDRVLDDERSALLLHLARRLKSNATQRAYAAEAKTRALEAENYLMLGNLVLMRAPQVEAALDAKLSQIVLHDEENKAHEIAIEADWSVGDNAQRLFNRYKRAQKLSAAAPARVRVLEDEKTRLEAWKSRAQNADSQELKAIAEASGLSRDAKKAVSRTRQQEESARPENKVRKIEIDGWTVFMGRSAIENQLLLSKIARPADVWMHVRDAPSAHVIIKNQKNAAVPERVLDEAARWLAQTSRRGKSGDVLEIIYTSAKFVRAIKGAPGRVTLARFQTRLVTT